MPNKSGLPEYEIDPNKTFSADDVNHIVARRIAQVQMENINQRVNSNESDMIKGFSELKAAIGNLEKTIEHSSHSLYKCRNELKDEMNTQMFSEFVHKETFDREMKVLDGKVDEQWKRITLAVVVAMAVLQIAFKLWGI